MRRRLTATCGVVALVVSAVLPPTHIHLAEHDHDHDHDAVEHAHWSPHAGASRLALDDDDGTALFVDHPATTTDAFHGTSAPTPVILTILSVPVPAALAMSSQRLAGNAPRDGPALGAATLRGPPRAS